MDPKFIAKFRYPGRFTSEQLDRSGAMFELDDVHHRIREACDTLGLQMASMLYDHMERTAYCWTAFESPIEMIFYAWWESFEASWAHINWHNVVGPTLTLMPQHEVEVDGQRFRLDFLVQPRVRSEESRQFLKTLFPKIAIELDGHDFHEKTKEQVTRRNQRDRVLQRHGWRVFHVSGSELARRPLEVMREIHEHCRREYDDFEFKVYEATRGTD